jgi:hypothetical protein
MVGVAATGEVVGSSPCVICLNHILAFEKGFPLNASA